jgi:chromosome segregation ATPase
MSVNQFVQIKEAPTLYRDVHSKGLVNTDNRALEEYKAAREKRKETNDSILQYKNDINTLKNEVTEIKDSLKLILESLNG